MPSLLPPPGTMAGATVTNAIVAAAPFIPGNDQQLGGTVVNVMALALNGLVTPIKMFDWFDQNKYLPWLLVIGGIALGILLSEDWRKGLLNGLASVPTALTNYGALKPLGLLPSGTDRRI